MTDTAELGSARPLPDVISFRLDGQGGAQEIAPDEAIAADFRPGDKGFIWLHMRRNDPGTPARLASLGLDPIVLQGLTAEETRPRCTVHGDGILLILRGVNLTPGAEPEDMVSIRLWLEGQRIIGIWVRPLHAVGDLLDAIGRGQAPVSPGEFVSKLVLRVTDRAEPAVSTLNEEIDELEEDILDPGTEESRFVLSDIRRRAILLRRYMIPQRDALTTLEIEDLPWLHERDRTRLREAAERVTQLGEELDAIRDRAVLDRLGQVGDHRQALVVDHQRLGGIARLRLAVGDDHRNRIADIAHRVDGEHREGWHLQLRSVRVRRLSDAGARIDVSKVVRRHHGEHARHRPDFVQIFDGEAGMGDRAAHHMGDRRVFGAAVGQIAALAGNEGGVFLAPQRRADTEFHGITRACGGRT